MLLRGTPRFRVKGARIIRWERVRVPFPILSGVKSSEELPRGASGFDFWPLPGRVASEGVTEPILRALMTVKTNNGVNKQSRDKNNN